VKRCCRVFVHDCACVFGSFEVFSDLYTED
jgi:hypothetical protein